MSVTAPEQARRRLQDAVEDTQRRAREAVSQAEGGTIPLADLVQDLTTASVPVDVVSRALAQLVVRGQLLLTPEREFVLPAETSVDEPGVQR